MYSIFAPGKTSLKAADAGNAALLLSTPQVQHYVASQVQERANQDGLIVSRFQHDTRPDLIDISLNFFMQNRALLTARELDAIHEVVSTWAKRSRVAGVSGERVAVVGPIEEVSHTATAVSYCMELRLGTAVFFNNRRVTVDFSEDATEFQLDLINLLDHLQQVGAVGTNSGVIVEHEEFGAIHSGATSSHSTAFVSHHQCISDKDLETHISDIAKDGFNLQSHDRSKLSDQLEDLIRKANNVLDIIA